MQEAAALLRDVCLLSNFLCRKLTCRYRSVIACAYGTQEYSLRKHLLRKTRELFT